MYRTIVVGVGLILARRATPDLRPPQLAYNVHVWSKWDTNNERAKQKNGTVLGPPGDALNHTIYPRSGDYSRMAGRGGPAVVLIFCA